eukprot:2673482-Heterocapsa_arctica.AAC.1
MLPGGGGVGPARYSSSLATVMGDLQQGQDASAAPLLRVPEILCSSRHGGCIPCPHPSVAHPMPGLGGSRQMGQWSTSGMGGAGSMS